jgi:multicomponent Na+:H+ antiporter subunit D
MMISLVPLFVAIPLGGAFVIVLLSRLSPKLSDIIAHLGALSLAVLSIFTINQPTLVYKMGGWGAIRGVPIGIYLVLDGLSSFMLIIINIIALLNLIYSVNYI